MGADEEPGRCAPVEAEGRRGRGYCAGCPRPVEASRAGHADHRPRVAVRPCLRKDFAALPRESGSVRGRIRPGVVQADAPRYGPAVALSWPARSQGAAAVAGPHSRSGSQIDRRRGHCRPQGQDPRIRTFHLPTGHHGLGVCGDVPRQRQARWSQRRAYSPGAAEELGSQPAGRTGQGPAEAGSDPEGLQQRAVWRQEGFACRPDRSGRLRSRRGGREEGRPRREGSLLARAHGCVAGS